MSAEDRAYEDRMRWIHRNDTEGETAEQRARDLLEACGVEDAQTCSAGDVVALANYVADSEGFIGSMRRSLRLYRKGLITAEEFANVTQNDLRVLDIRAEDEKWGPE